MLEKPYEANSKIDKDELEELVIKLRKGDTTVINRIVEMHMRLGISIASRYAYKYPSKVDDLIGEMGLALTKSVWRAITRLYDNNITPYISSEIHGQLMKFIEDDRCLRVPGRTVRQYVVTGDPRLDKLPARFNIIENKSDSLLSIEEWKSDVEVEFLVVPETRDQSLLEIQECLDKSTSGIIEKRVIELRAEGYTLEEIGPQVGYSKSAIQIIVSSVEEKFNKYYGA